MEASNGKTNGGDSRSAIAEKCQSGGGGAKEDLLAVMAKRNFPHSIHNMYVESKSQERVQDKQQQPQESGQLCCVEDAAYDSKDETPRSLEPIMLSNGQYGASTLEESRNGTGVGDIDDGGKPKGALRKLCEQSNQPLHEAIRSLEQLNQRIDAFRQSPIWQQNPAIREEPLLLRTPSSLVSSLSESPVDDKLKQVANTNDKGSVIQDRKSDSGIVVVDDCSSATVAGSSSASTTSPEDESKDVESRCVGKKQGRLKRRLTFELGVQMIQDLLLDTQRQCTNMVNENQRTASRFDDELDRCQNQMDILRKDLAYADRCVNDLEVNMMINGSATESDTEFQSAEHAMEAEIYRLREDNNRLRSQFRVLQRELLLERQAAAENLANGNALASVSTSSASVHRQSDTDSFPRASATGHPPIGQKQQQIASIQAAANHPSSPRNSHNSLSVCCSPAENNNNRSTDEEATNAAPTTGMESASFSDLQLELVHAREALIALKHDRKRLKSEKVELLNQMKDVYQTLEAKERELRDFIRQFEQKMRESDKGIKELIWEKEKLEKEKRQMSDALEKANEKNEQCKVDLDKEKADNAKLQAQLKELQGRFVLLTGQSPQLYASPAGAISTAPSSAPTTNAAAAGNRDISLPVSPTASSSAQPAQVMKIPKYDPADTTFTPEEAALLRRRQKPSQESAKAHENRRTTSKFLSQVYEHPTATVGTNITYYEDTGGASDSTQSTKQHLAQLTRGRASGRKSQDLSKINTTPSHERSASSTNSGGGAANRLSRLFHFTGHGGGRSKSKEEQLSKQKEIDLIDRSSSTIAVDAIAADLNLVEKADQLLQARQIPMTRWRQSHVVAWLELELGMYAYTAKFMDNVKSGKVLLSLTDHEIENVLGVTAALHKKKLRLAIEEYRAPALCKFPAIKEVTNQYVCRQWLPSIGMPQYIHSFRHHLIDGRLLNYLNKKQLDKYLGVARRFHQLTILKGIELLRLFNFDIKALSKRRLECERENVDLLVWTNARLGKWCEQIDLGEYTDNLRESGLHGGLCVLDPSFTIDTFATALGIPSGRPMVRKHLAAEFLPLLNQAKSHLDNYQSHTKSHGHRTGGSLGRAFSRSYTISGEQDFASSTPPADPKQQRLSSKRRRGFRGSIGRVFGLRSRRSTASACIDDHVEIDGLSPVRSSTMANIGVTTGTILESRPVDSGSAHELQPPQTTSTQGNVSSPKPLNRSTGTLSSTTSDLGSSIERSQHMKTILGTPKVLTQPPLTSMTSSKTNVVSAGTTTVGGILKSSISDAADLSRLQHLCLSPGEVLLNGGGVASSRNPLVRLRNKTRFGVGDVPKMGVSVANGGSTRSPGSAPARPHSVGDFGRLASFYYSPNSANNYQPFNGGQHCQNVSDRNPGGPWWKQNGAKVNEALSESFVSFSPQRLQTWLSAEHFAVPSNGGLTKEIMTNGQKSSTSTQNEEQAADSTHSNGLPGQPQSFTMGTISEHGEPLDSENDTIPREYCGSDRKLGNNRRQHDSRPTSPHELSVAGQSHYYRQNSKTPRPEPSPSRSSSSSLSPSRRDRPRSLPIKEPSTSTNQQNALYRQNLHYVSATSTNSSNCEDCSKTGSKREDVGRNVRRQRSVPPLASTDSIHETDL